MNILTPEDMTLIDSVLVNFGMHRIDTDLRMWIAVRAVKTPRDPAYDRDNAANALALAGYHATHHFHTGLQIFKL